MHPFVAFAIVVIVIWVLSSIAAAVNKQKELERRRRVREEYERRPAGMQTDPSLRTREDEAQRIAEGIAARFPDVLLPPELQPPQRRPQRRPTPTMSGRSAPPPIPRQQVKQQGKQQKKRRTAVAPPAAPVQAASAPPSASLVVAAPSMPTRQSTSTASVSAPALSRWLQPNTLRRQFILTEVFQPPLGLRGERQI